MNILYYYAYFYPLTESSYSSFGLYALEQKRMFILFPYNQTYYSNNNNYNNNDKGKIYTVCSIYVASSLICTLFFCTLSFNKNGDIL